MAHMSGGNIDPQNVSATKQYILLPWRKPTRGRYDTVNAQKMKFSIKDFFSKYDQIRKKLRIWPHLLKKSLMENFIFCAVTVATEA